MTVQETATLWIKIQRLLNRLVVLTVECVRLKALITQGRFSAIAIAMTDHIGPTLETACLVST